VPWFRSDKKSAGLVDRGTEIGVLYRRGQVVTPIENEIRKLSGNLSNCHADARFASPIRPRE
jgi:hypothetical protein